MQHLDNQGREFLEGMAGCQLGEHTRNVNKSPRVQSRTLDGMGLESECGETRGTRDDLMVSHDHAVKDRTRNQWVEQLSISEGGSNLW